MCVFKESQSDENNQEKSHDEKKSNMADHFTTGLRNINANGLFVTHYQGWRGLSQRQSFLSGMSIKVVPFSRKKKLKYQSLVTKGQMWLLRCYS